jgi:hypothetical protein
MLFGSDFPLIKPERWIEDFKALDFDDETMRLILKDNAVRVLGLERTG